MIEEHPQELDQPQGLTPETSKGRESPLSKTFHSIVSGFRTKNIQAEAGIAAATQDHTIASEEEQNLQAERKGCLTVGLGALSKVVPERFKFSLYEQLEKQNLDKAYIYSLDPQEQISEFYLLTRTYRERIATALYNVYQRPSAEVIAEVERLTDNLIFVTQRHGVDDFEQQQLINVIGQIGRTGRHVNWHGEPEGPEDLIGIEARSRLAKKLAEFTIQHVDENQGLELVKTYATNFTDSPAFLINQLPEAAKTKAVGAIIEGLPYILFDRGEYIFTLLEGLTVDQRQEFLRPLVNEVLQIPSKEKDRKIALFRRVLSYSRPEERPKLLEMLVQDGWSRLITIGYDHQPHAQLAEIVAITADPAEQDDLFFAIASSSDDYRGFADYDVNAAITRAKPCPHIRNFVLAQIRGGYLSAEATRTYGAKEIWQMLHAVPISIQAVSAAAKTYGVGLGPFREYLEPLVAAPFRAGKMTPDHRVLAKLLEDEIELTTDWESFTESIDMSPEHGERTWRREQSVIDLLQNHLDADDYSEALELVRAAIGDDELSALAENPHELGRFASRLWLFRERWPLPKEEVWKYSLAPLNEEPAIIAQRIASVEHKKPKINLLISQPEGEELWIPQEQIVNYSASHKIIGVRFIDSGLGYDEKLNAAWLPTKQDLAFLRGKFGEGSKMAMAGLLREGCTVKMRSNYAIEETGERVEWEAGPEINETSRILQFTGKKKRSFGGTTHFETGSVTEIHFATANSAMQRLFHDMFDLRSNATRLESEGIAQYVLDYQPPGAYCYGRFDNQTQVSTIPGQRSRIYVQGLQVPVQTDMPTMFGYNFSSADILTGRDRIFLEPDRTKVEICNVWGGITDPKMVDVFINAVVLNENVGRYIEGNLLSDLRWRLTPEAKVVHQNTLKQRLGLTEEQPKIVLVPSQEYTRDADLIGQLKQAGFVVVVGSDRFESINFIKHVLDCDSIYTLRDAHSLLHPEPPPTEVPENLKREFSDLLTTARAEIETVLEESDLNEANNFLKGQEVFLAPRLSTFAQREWFEVTIHYDDIQHEWRGYDLHANLDNIFGGNTYPDQLTPDQELQLQFAMEVQLLNIAARGAKRGYETYMSAPYVYGQDAANEILIANAKDSPLLPFAQAASIRPEEVNIPQYSAEAVMQQDEPVVQFQEDLDFFSLPDQVLDQVNSTLTRINQACEDAQFLNNRREEIINLTGRQYCFNDQLFEITADTGFYLEGKIKLELREIPHTILGEKNGYQVWLAGTGENARLVMPIDFARNKSLVLRDGLAEQGFSKYNLPTTKRQWSQDITASLGPYSIFRGTLGSSFISQAVVENGTISFPIGTPNLEHVGKRVKYFMEEYPLEIAVSGQITEEEQNRGAAVLVTKFGIEYGEGKVWDDPIRIFGDIMQNHLDAGKPAIKYQVLKDGKKEWVDETTLLSSAYQDAQLVGTSFSDDGDGYTTRQLKVLESKKKAGGTRGKFGEGLKMLSLGVVRNGFALKLTSRDWQANATTTAQNFVVNSRLQVKNMLVFDMSWQTESTPGSTTELTLPDQTDENARAVWQQWMAVVDPRQKNNLGHRGLVRYIRELRPPNTENILKIGPVTILLDEPGAFYEGGLVIPEGEDRLGKHYLFGYDIDDDIAATRERNVIDPKKLEQHLTRVFKHLPLAACVKIMEAVRFQNAFSDERLRPLVEELLSQYKELDANTDFEEFSLIKHLEVIEPLRLAYYQVFGEHALLSSAVSANRNLLMGKDENGTPLTEEKQAELKALIAYEEHHYPPECLLKLEGPRFNNLLNKLGDLVQSTQSHLETHFNAIRELQPQEQEAISNLVIQTAQELAANMEALYESPRGRLILESLFSAPDRKVRDSSLLDQLSKDGPTSAMIMFLNGVATGLIPLNLSVQPSLASEAFVHGLINICFADRMFSNPQEAVAVTMHELLHLASATRDYSTAFIGFLLLANPTMAKRFL